MKPEFVGYPGEEKFRDKIINKVGEAKLEKFKKKMKQAGFLFIEHEKDLSLHFELKFPIKGREGNYHIVHVYADPEKNQLVETNWFEVFQGEIQDDGNFEYRERELKKDEIPDELIKKMSSKLKEVGLIE